MANDIVRFPGGQTDHTAETQAAPEQVAQQLQVGLENCHSVAELLGYVRSFRDNGHLPEAEEAYSRILKIIEIIRGELTTAGGTEIKNAAVNISVSPDWYRRSLQEGREVARVLIFHDDGSSYFTLTVHNSRLQAVSKPLAYST